MEGGVIVLPCGEPRRDIEHLRTIILELDKALELMAGNIDAELPEGMIESRHRSLVRRQSEPLQLLP